MKKQSPLPEIVRKPLLFLTAVSFTGAGGVMLLSTLFVVAICIWASVDKLSYWNWLSASATVVQHEDSDQRATSNRSRSMTSCPVIRFSDRTGKSYNVRSTCAETSPSRRKPLRPAYWKGKAVTVWYDPSNPSRTLIAAEKPQFNPFCAINIMSLLFGSLAVGFLVGAKISMDELQKPNGTLK